MITAITIVGISLLIILHELGHYWVARAAGMRVVCFSVGFGPTLVSRKVGETLWQLAAIPFGGYVQIQGMGPSENEASDGRGFRDKPLWQRALVLVAGPVANWLIAAVCLIVLALSVGLHDDAHPTTELGNVAPDTAAAKAGLLPADRIVAINGVAIDDWAALVQQVRKYPGQTIPIVFEREGQRRTVEATPTPSSGGVGTGSSGPYGVLGVEPSAALLHFGVVDGIAAGFMATVRLTTTQAQLLWGVITGRQEGRLSGLPGIVRTLSAQAKRSLLRFFETLATLSVVLFILNLTPIPSLDGSRLVFLGVEALRRKPSGERLEGWVHAVGLVLLLGLILVVSVRDLL